VPTPAVTEDYVFILRDRGVMFCLDLESGEVVWGPERIDAAVYSASPVVADGRVYVTSEAGKTTVLAAGPEFRVLAENTVDEYTLASLAVADGHIYLRTAGHLYAIGRGEG
jgi:outer membrane protein assembly factor BamB